MLLLKVNYPSGRDQPKVQSLERRVDDSILGILAATAWQLSSCAVLHNCTIGMYLAPLVGYFGKTSENSIRSPAKVNTVSIVFQVLIAKTRSFTQFIATFPQLFQTYPHFIPNFAKLPVSISQLLRRN